MTTRFVFDRGLLHAVLWGSSPSRQGFPRLPFRPQSTASHSISAPPFNWPGRWPLAR
jgi:hypothetical protein